MIKNEVDAITLQYFVNNKFGKSISLENDNLSSTVTNADRKFYKKRILQLMKDIFKKQAPNDLLQSTFDSFVFSSISYFKFIDASEVMQEEYQDIKKNEDTVENATDNIDMDTVDEGIFNVSSSENTLDSFVTSKTVKMTNKILPKMRPINITTDKFKTKGVKEKKEKKENKKKDNIKNIYGKAQSEEKSQTEIRKEQ
jgi:hypothetical protein